MTWRATSAGPSHEKIGGVDFKDPLGLKDALMDQYIIFQVGRCSLNPVEAHVEAQGYCFSA